MPPLYDGRKGNQGSLYQRVCFAGMGVSGYGSDGGGGGPAENEGPPGNASRQRDGRIMLPALARI